MGGGNELLCLVCVLVLCVCEEPGKKKGTSGVWGSVSLVFCVLCIFLSIDVVNDDIKLVLYLIKEFKYQLFFFMISSKSMCYQVIILSITSQFISIVTIFEFN